MPVRASATPHSRPPRSTTSDNKMEISPPLGLDFAATSMTTADGGIERCSLSIPMEVKVFSSLGRGKKSTMAVKIGSNCPADRLL